MQSSRRNKHANSCLKCAHPRDCVRGCLVLFHTPPPSSFNDQCYGLDYRHKLLLILARPLFFFFRRCCFFLPPASRSRQTQEALPITSRASSGAKTTPGRSRQHVQKAAQVCRPSPHALSAATLAVTSPSAGCV